MPNWVYNYITVSGKQDDVKQFAEHIRKKPDRWTEGVEWNNDSFSYHSFITPDKSVTDDEYHGTNGWKEGERVGDTPNNWYQWNTGHWGVKWDASSTNVSVCPDSVELSFESPWGCPEPVFFAMSTQFPDLEFEIRWEEEQGYGAELVGKGSSFTITKEWDIPASHADHVEQDKECNCAHESDQSYWFDDCPGKDGKKVFTVEAVTKRFIIAYSAEEALEAAKAEEGGYDLPENTEVKDTLYAEEFRVVDEEKMEEENE